MAYNYVELGTLITPSKTVRCGDGVYPVLSMTMHNGLVFQDEKFKKVIASKDTSDYKVVYRNQLVISFPIDEGVLAAQRITDAGIVSPAYGIWNINQSKILPEFLEYALRCDRAIQYYKAKLRGSTARRRTLPTPTLLAFLVPLPCLEEQKMVIDRIHRAQSVIEKRKEQINKLDDLIKARFVEMFGNPVKNTMGWETKPLGSLATKIGSGATPKGGKESYREDGISLIRSMNVRNAEFDYKDLAHISDEQASKLDNVIIEENDVLLNITGASVARSCIAPDVVLPARVNQHVCIIRCRNYIDPIFLNRLLTDDNYQDLLWGIAGSGATREAITKQQVESLTIITPPRELQEPFAQFVAQVDKSKSDSHDNSFTINCSIAE